MKSAWKWLVAAVVLVLITFAAVVISVERYHRTGPFAQERRMLDEELQPLLQAHASREQVVQILGLKWVVDYSSSSTNRLELERQVAIPPKVRQAVERHQVVLFSTTAMTMTWLVFGVDGTLQDYYLCEQ